MSDRFEVRAICEQVAHRAEKAANEFHAAKVDGYRALARRGDIDAVLMLSPQWYGTLPIHAACDAGKAIYCAAAMDMSPHEASEVKKRVEEAGIAFMVEFPRRLAPATLRLKELIATQLGRPRLLISQRRRSFHPQQEEQDASVKRELIEMVDWCHYLVNQPPTAVTGSGQPATPTHGSFQSLSVEFRSEGDASLAQISCGNYLPDAWEEARSFRAPSELQVSCESGIAFIDLPSTLVWFNEAGRHVESLEAELPVGEQLFSQFHRAVTSFYRSTDDLDNAHLALSTVLEAERSQREGRRIELT